MRNKRYWLCAALLVFLSLVGLYFIFVNTTLKDKVLPNIRLAGENISLANNAQIEEVISQKYLAALPENLKVRFEGQIFYVPIGLMDVKADYSQILNYGKGNDLVKVVLQGFALIGGKDMEPELTFSIEPIINSLPYHTVAKGAATLAAQTVLDAVLPLTGQEPAGDSYAFFDGTILRNCSSNNYQFTFDQNKIKTAVRSALQNDTVFNFELNRFLTDPTQFDVVSYCKIYQENIRKLNVLFPQNADWDDILNFKIDSANKTLLEVRDQYLMLDFLHTIKTAQDVPPVEGAYVESDGKLYMYKPYTEGKSLNLATTLQNLETWLSDPERQGTILNFEIVKPAALLTGKELVNMTKLLASGKSRLDINRDGRHNYRVENAQVALDHLNNTIVAPGQEVSFFKISGMQDGGVQAGLGVCNASTTFFRAALEAGFPITERHPHTSQIWSYEYPFYPINIVEATFFAAPVVDTKFINDLQYPILLHFVIDRKDAENWQYHTIEVYTSPQAPERKVELHDFAKSKVKDNSHFVGSFFRTVKDNGLQVREDKWVSYYFN